jgi:hypothetical protein
MIAGVTPSANWHRRVHTTNRTESMLSGIPERVVGTSAVANLRDDSWLTSSVFTQPDQLGYRSRTGLAVEDCSTDLVDEVFENMRRGWIPGAYRSIGIS